MNFIKYIYIIINLQYLQPINFDYIDQNHYNLNNPY